jgi:hypothetical protein
MNSSSAKGADLLALDAGLAGEGEGFQRPALGQVRSADAPLQRAFLPRVPLGTQQSRHELGVGKILFFGRAYLLVIDLQDAPELQVLQ